MKTNSEILSTVIPEMSANGQAQLKGVRTGVDFLNVAQNNLPIMNEFINTLTNKITKTVIYSKVFSNPLKELKKGKVEYGETIEELFVEMAQIRGFKGSWETGAKTPEADLIRKLIPKVSALYVKVNVDYKAKTTIMDKQLRKAFINEGGLSNLVGQIVSSITSSMEFKEFELTKKTLSSLIEKCETITEVAESGEITVGKITTGVKQGLYCKAINMTNPSNLVEGIRAESGNMKFPSTKYNVAKERNWCNPEDLMLMTTSNINAKLDVNVLANAFNVSSTDIKTKTIIVDEMPTGIFKKTAIVDGVPETLTSADTLVKENKEILAILFDKELTQIWDTHQGAGTFHNPEGEYTNHFANREGIFATCLFANCVVFYKA